MARWRLMQPHYLNVPDTEWEYKEVNRTSGKPQRKVYQVPRMLHPDDSGDYTHPELQAIIVCYEGKGEARDLTFFGEPTPDMEPLDAEAQAISDSCRGKWVAPMGADAFPAQGGYGGARAEEFLKELTALMAAQQPVAPTSAPNVSVDEFEALKKQVALLLEQNALLQAQANPEPVAAPARRV